VPGCQSPFSGEQTVIYLPEAPLVLHYQLRRNIELFSVVPMQVNRQAGAKIQRYISGEACQNLHFRRKTAKKTHFEPGQKTPAAGIAA
jgi:hypothetical protein